MIAVQTLTNNLETVFARIQFERMSDVPILNTALQVQAVGFRKWEDYSLGVLITPWFMNLMLLPIDDNKWSELSIGSKVKHVFPSGSYEFIRGEEEGIGNYLMCSLFSPVFEFETQEIAIATAEAVMEGLMNEDCRDDVSTHEDAIQKIWNDVDHSTAMTANEEEQEQPAVRENNNNTMSRRDLLRGAFLHREQ